MQVLHPAPTWHLTTVCNSSSRKATALFWPPWVLQTHGALTYRQAKHPYTSNKTNRDSMRKANTLGGPSRTAVGAYALLDLAMGSFPSVTMILTLDGDKPWPGTQVIPSPESSRPWPWGPSTTGLISLALHWWFDSQSPGDSEQAFPEPVWISSPYTAQAELRCAVSHGEGEGWTTSPNRCIFSFMQKQQDP